VNLEFVQYEALHDKIVTDQVGGSGQTTRSSSTPVPAEMAKANIVQTSPTDPAAKSGLDTA
jgi:hypothetical protein